MTEKARIFLSTVTKELLSARELVAHTLSFLECEPVVQEEFGSTTGVVKGMLEERIKPCVALIQIVGHRYGWDVPGAANPTECMSYTQYEAHYAHQRGVPVWYLVIGDDYLVDHPNDEDKTKNALQAAYRVRVTSTAHLRYECADAKDVELVVLKMLKELDRFREPSTRWIRDGSEAADVSRDLPTLPATPPPMPAEMEALMRGLLREFVPALQQAKQQVAAEKLGDADDELYHQVAAVWGVPVEKARAEMEAAATRLRQDVSAPLLDRAKTAYAERRYAEAEELAVRAVAELRAAGDDRRSDVIAAWEMAGDAARDQVKYAPALAHYRAAVDLTDKNRDLLEWARVRNRLGGQLHLSGEYRSQESLMAEVWRALRESEHAESQVVLRARNLHANALDSLGRHVDAEAEHRAVLGIRERVLGAEHPDTLSSRNNLANALDSQGKHVEAEAEHRVVLAVRKRTLGSEHPDFFQSCYNLALCLEARSKPKEALEFVKRAEEGWNKGLGPDHPHSQLARRHRERIEAALAGRKGKKR